MAASSTSLLQATKRLLRFFKGQRGAFVFTVMLVGQHGCLSTTLMADLHKVEAGLQWNQTLARPAAHPAAPANPLRSRGSDQPVKMSLSAAETFGGHRQHSSLASASVSPLPERDTSPDAHITNNAGNDYLKQLRGPGHRSTGFLWILSFNIVTSLKAGSRRVSKSQNDRSVPTEKGEPVQIHLNPETPNQLLCFDNRVHHVERPLPPTSLIPPHPTRIRGAIFEGLWCMLLVYQNVC